MQINHLKIIGVLLIMIFIAAYYDSRNNGLHLPTDQRATKETTHLYKQLKKAAKKGIILGNPDALAHGVNWIYKAGRNDVKSFSGDYPTVFGWDLGHVELGDAVNIDKAPFYNIKSNIEEAYYQNGVISISWHGTNPLTGGSCWDATPGTVASILPGGDKHELFKFHLDNIANFLNKLEGKKMEAVPVLFRPYHERAGETYWWSRASCSTEEYIRLFRFTVNYLKDDKKLHNLLYVFATDEAFKNEDEYLERYPGDDVIDILSFNPSQQKDSGDTENRLDKEALQLSIVSKIAKERNKLIIQIPLPDLAKKQSM